MTQQNTERLILGLLLAGTVLRLALFWVNPADNAFDDHFEPISLILQNGVPAGKLDCWECYQPPVYYVVSALVAKLLFVFDLPSATVAKGLQLLNCLYGIATLGVVLQILRRLPISDFARVLAFGTICFLPRHIYMGALHSNDTLSYLLVALSILLLLRAMNGHKGWRDSALLGVAVTAAIFTKYTALSLLPLVGLGLAVGLAQGRGVQVVVRRALLVLALPTVLLGAYMIDNHQRYGSALPFNTVLYDPARHQPSDPGGAEFASFSPWKFVDKPILWPGQISSFWTLLHASMWFDSEPQFLPRLKGEDASWWQQYFNWLNGRSPAPPSYAEGAGAVWTTGSALVALGLIPLMFVVVGLLQAIRTVVHAFMHRDWGSVIGLQSLLLLFVLNLAGVVRLVLGTPVLSAMKASYLLTSLPAMAVFLALGVMTWERYAPFRVACHVLFAALFALVAFNTTAIVLMSA